MNRLSPFLILGIFLAANTSPAYGAEINGNSGISRSEAAAILLHSRGSLPAPRRIHSYPDLIGSEWYAPWLRAAIDLKMIDPYPIDGLIRPHRPVTRAEFLKMMKYAYSLPTNTPHAYVDVIPEAWYSPYAGAAYKHKLFGGYGERALLYPTAQLTKQEGVNAINRLLETLPKFHPYKKVALSNYRPAPKKVVTTKPAVRRTSLTRSILERAMERFLKRTFPSENTKLELIKLLNVERAKVGVSPLTYDAYLESAAQLHAKDMHDRGYFSHFTPEGLNYVDRIRKSGYLDRNPDACQCKEVFNVDPTKQGPNYVIGSKKECNCNPNFSLGENLAKGQVTVEHVIQSWMNSPPHKRNVLQTQFNEVGIGIFDDIWVLAFGRLKFPNN